MKTSIIFSLVFLCSSLAFTENDDVIWMDSTQVVDFRTLNKKRVQLAVRSPGARSNICRLEIRGDYITPVETLEKLQERITVNRANPIKGPVVFEERHGALIFNFDQGLPLGDGLIFETKSFMPIKHEFDDIVSIGRVVAVVGLCN